MEDGFYIYAIAATSSSEAHDIASIDGNGETVQTLPQGDIAAIVSRCHADRYDVTRANMLAHQRVMEAAMKCWPILPVRFDSIAESREQIIEKLLIPRRQEFGELLDVMAGKVELGLKALWTDMGAIFSEIAEKDRDIQRARAKESISRGEVIQVGEMVKNALERIKEEEAKRILRRFDGLWFDRKVNDVFGDSMILNVSFLVERERENQFDQVVEALSGEMNGRVRLKYVGPIPPCNFVEIVVSW